MMLSPTASLPTLVFIPFVGAFLALCMGRIAGHKTGYLMVLSALASFILAAMLYAGLDPAAPVVCAAEWLPGVDVNFRLRGDGFGLFFALLVSGIGTLVGIYSLSYVHLSDNRRVARYYAALIAFMGAMLGLALADDLVLLFVFWEITSITSFLLIGFWYDQEIGRKGALMALQVTVGGGLAMMAGFVVIGAITGSYSISELAADPSLREKLVAAGMLTPALLLCLGGALTKSAQMPFHFWLPKAMVAPTPVSTYLHAATMVMAGVFLVGRLLPILGDSPAWTPILTTVGLVTFFLGAYQSLREFDLKAILAYATVSTLGLLMMLYGLKAADQDVLQIWSHGAYKGTLFLVAGIVEHATHTRDLRKLGGLRKVMPITFGVCLLGAISMSGLPPFFGFLAKEAFYAQLLHGEVLHGQPVLQWTIIVLSVLANAFIFAVACKLVFGVFFGPPAEDVDAVDHHAHEAGIGLWGPAAVLGLVALGMGLAYPITSQMVNGMSSDPHAHVHVSLIPHDIGPVAMSAVTVLLGIGIYLMRRPINRLQDALAIIPPMYKFWDWLMAGITAVSVTFSRQWQNGSLRWYFSGVLLFACVLVTAALNRADFLRHDIIVKPHDLYWPAVAISGMLIFAALILVRAQVRLTAALASTAIGFLVALLFVIYRSPDILLTQLLIETVSTIFILLVLFFMPRFSRDVVAPPVRLVRLIVSILVGFTMATMVFLCTLPELRTEDNLGLGYLERSLSEGFGRNAVNVIIVDMRAIDTTGEITVLVVVGMAVFGLLRTRRHKA